MQTTRLDTTWESVERNPITWLRRSLLIMFVLAICGLVVDFVSWGPIRASFWDVLVVRPVERSWGFHAEWTTDPDGGPQLIIRQVQPGGPFERAGIMPGTLVPHPRCAWYALRGGFYGQLADAKSETVLRLIPDHLQVPEERTVVVRR
jgi:hypothetical protein